MASGNYEQRLITHQSPQVAFLSTQVRGPYDRDETVLPTDDNGTLRFVDLDVASFPFAGQNDVTFFNDFYFRIHVLPSALNLGNILSVQTENLTLFNAYLDPRSINSYMAPTVTGVSVQEPIVAPYVMAALEEVTYVITVAASGPPQFNDEITWTIDGKTFTVPISGRRVVVWPFAPNWKSGVREQLAWRTDVLPSFDGSEQRMSIRSEPRMSMSYQILIEQVDAQLFRHLLHGWQNRQYAVPIWQDGVTLGSGIAAGVTTIPINPVGRAFYVEGLVLIISGTQTFEVVQIDALGINTITIQKPTENQWEATAQVYPIVQAILPTNVPTKQVTSTVTQASLTFTAVPSDNTVALPTLTPENEYLGREILLRKPNWQSSLTYDHAFDYDMLDFQIGTFQQIQRGNYSKQNQQVDFLLESREQINQFKGLLKRLQGRFRSIWLPTWLADFDIVEPIALNSSAIRVKQSLYGAMRPINSSQNHLVINLRDGTRLIRLISGVTQSDEGTEVVSIQPSIPLAVPVRDVLQISIVHLVRLQSDQVEITHQVRGKAEVSAKFEVINQ